MRDPDLIVSVPASQSQEVWDSVLGLELSTLIEINNISLTFYNSALKRGHS